MERLLFVMVWTGFITLTAAIGSGFLYLDDMFAQHVVHHTVLSSGLLVGVCTPACWASLVWLARRFGGALDLSGLRSAPARLSGQQVRA